MKTSQIEGECPFCGFVNQYERSQVAHQVSCSACENDFFIPLPLEISDETGYDSTLGAVLAELPDQPEPLGQEPKQQYFVIRSYAKMLSVGKIAPDLIELLTTDLTEAVAASDQATKATGEVHYVLTLTHDNEKVRILHTSGLAKEGDEDESSLDQDDGNGERKSIFDEILVRHVPIEADRAVMLKYPELKARMDRIANMNGRNQKWFAQLLDVDNKTFKEKELEASLAEANERIKTDQELIDSELAEADERQDVLEAALTEANARKTELETALVEANERIIELNERIIELLEKKIAAEVGSTKQEESLEAAMAEANDRKKEFETALAEANGLTKRPLSVHAHGILGNAMPQPTQLQWVIIWITVLSAAHIWLNLELSDFWPGNSGGGWGLPTYVEPADKTRLATVVIVIGTLLAWMLRKKVKFGPE